MNINYKIFLKHAEKVAKTAHESRPILKGIHHDDKGTVTVTDSHRLYQAYNLNAPKSAVLHAITGEDITENGAYPNVSRLVPETDLEEGIRLTITDMKKFISLLKAMQTVAQAEGYKKDEALIKLTKNGITLYFQEDDKKERYTFVCKPDFTRILSEMDEEVETVIKTQMMIELAEFFKDIKVKEMNIFVKLHHQTLYIRPENDEVKAIIAPVIIGR